MADTRSIVENNLEALAYAALSSASGQNVMIVGRSTDDDPGIPEGTYGTQGVRASQEREEKEDIDG